MNYALIGINVVVHFWLVTRPGDVAEAILANYALIPAELAWRTAHSLVTSMFLHADLAHLGGNMLFLWIVGNAVEDRLGHAGYLFTYLLCGLAAAGVDVFTTADPAIPTIGASGAISGVLGLYAAFYPDSRIKFFYWLGIVFGWTRVRAVWAIVIWFALQLFDWFASLGDLTAGVAYGAHVGGFLLGLVAAVIVQRVRPVLGVDGKAAPVRARKRGEHVPVLAVFVLAVAGGAALRFSGLAVPSAGDGSGPAPAGTPESIARSVHDDLRRGEFARVHDRLSESYRRSISRQGLEGLVRADPDAFAAPLRDVNVSADGPRTKVHGSVTAGPRTATLVYSLLQAEGTWVVDAIQVTGSVEIPEPPGPVTDDSPGEPPGSVVERLVRSLARGDIEAAWKCCSTRLRSESSAAALAARFEPVRGLEVAEVRPTDGGATVRAVADRPGGAGAEFSVVRESNAWLVDGFEIHLPPLAPDQPSPRLVRRGEPVLAGSIVVRLAPEPDHPARLVIEFDVRDFGTGADGACRLSVDLAILDPEGVSLLERNAFDTLRREFAEREPLQHHWTVRADLPAPPARGAHEIWLVVRDEVSGKKVQGRSSIRLGK